MKWFKPKLVVLYKGTPQENLLDICKNGAPLEVSAMPTTDKLFCQDTYGEGEEEIVCEDCRGLTS